MCDNNNCLICGLSDIEDVRDDGVWQEIPCKNCGTIYFTMRLFWQLKEERTAPKSHPDTLFKIACLLYEQKLKGKTGPIAFYSKNEEKPESSPHSSPCYECEDWIKSFPVDPLAKIDRTLLNLKNLVGENFVDAEEKLPCGFSSYEDGSMLTTKEQAAKELKEQQSTKVMFCKDRYSANQLMDLMQDLGYMNRTLRITAKGWQRISELYDQQTENSETCFVAMQFCESTKQYREAVSKAVWKAGYRPDEITVDKVEHNDFIMDKVINLINESRFVIADFTTMPENDKNDGQKVSNGVRGGVYWEAGYARGQGKEVIHTRKEDEASRRRLHFDIEQINTLFWKEDNLDTFTENLTERIKATVGKGPLPIE